MQHHFALRARQRQFLGLALLVITAFVLIAALSWTPQPAAQAQSGGWSTPDRVTLNNFDAITPDIAIDSEGVSHVVFVDSNFQDRNTAYYSNNRGGSWNSRVKMSADYDRAVDVAIDTQTVGGQVYVAIVYGVNNGLYYQLSTDGGRNWSSNRIASESSGEPSIVIDPSGVIHVTYRGPGDGQFAIFYRNSANWGLRGELQAGEAVNGQTEIDYNFANNQLTLHVVFRAQQNFGSTPLGDIKVYHSRKVGNNAWERRELSSNGAGSPDIATNKSNNVYVVIVRKQDGVDFEPFFYRSTNNGDSWTSGNTAVGPRTDDLSRVAAIAYAPNSNLGVVTSDDFEASQENIYGRISTDHGSSWSGIQRIFQREGISSNPSMDGGSNKVQTVWSDTADGKFRIFLSTYQFGPAGPTNTPTNTPRPTSTHTPTPEPRPEIDMVLLGTPNSDPELTTQNVVDVRFNITSGSANSYRLSNDATNWQDYKALPADNVVQDWVIEDSTSEACVFRTVYGQVRDDARSSFPSEVDDASIVYDPGVDATAVIQNPNLTENPKSVVQDFAANGNGASDGAPNYTRSNFYYAEVIANPGECSGIQSVTFSQLLEPTALAASDAAVSATPKGGRVQELLPFAEFDISDGPKTVRVEVTDRADHTREFQGTIIRDTAAPQVLSDTASLELTSRTEAISTTDSVLVLLSFENLRIQDNLYGQLSNEDKPFWGVWMANSRTFIPITDTATLDTTLDWQPVEIYDATSTNDGYNFSTGWSLMKGIAEEDLTPGDYYVYARILDGAGNASTYTMVSNSIELEPGFTIPRVYLPLFVR